MPVILRLFFSVTMLPKENKSGNDRKPRARKYVPLFSKPPIKPSIIFESVWVLEVVKSSPNAVFSLE